MQVLYIEGRRFLSTPSARRATKKVTDVKYPAIFLSTPSARRATDVPAETYQTAKISIHALCEEGDLTVEIRLTRHN